MRKTKGHATSFDAEVGERIRHARNYRCLSQEKLAKAADITFQQVQKYERGVNRVASERLYVFAKVLELPITYFFGELTRNEDQEKVARKLLKQLSEAS